MDALPSTRNATDTFIAKLYGGALVAPPARFRTWALEQVSKLIPCDAALWGSGTATDLRFHTTTTIGLPDEFPTRLEETAGINPLLPKIVANLGSPVDMESVLDDQAFHASEIYRKAFAPFRIERILATGHRDDRSGLYSLVSLYRRDSAARFTTVEKALQQRVTLHLFEAASHSFFVHLMRNTDMVEGRGSALVDKHGMYHEAQPRFHDLLDEEFPERGISLPFAVPEAGERTTHGKLCVSCDKMGELFMLQIWSAGPLDGLTSREREVVISVAQGLSFKQAARKIGIAPSTVANHLYRIYRKLGVSSRSELATLVHPRG